MLGWHITVSKQLARHNKPAKRADGQGDVLAVWQAGLSGIDWLHDLAKQKQATCLGGSGYPTDYTAQAKFILPFLENPPSENKVWGSDVGDVLLSNYLGKTTRYPEVIAKCSPEEWLLVRIWDES